MDNLITKELEMTLVWAMISVLAMQTPTQMRMTLDKASIMDLVHPLTQVLELAATLQLTPEQLTQVQPTQL